MSLSREELALEEARLKYRTARLAWLTAIFVVIGAVLAWLVFQLEGKPWHSYIRIPKEIEETAQKNRRPYNPSEPVPFLNAKADGPDLYIEAGLDLQIASDRAPDGTGNLDARIWDYPPGVYRIQEAPRAVEVLAFLQSSMQEFLGRDLGGYDVEMEVIGSADGIRVREGAVYRGDLGDIRDVPYFSYDREEPGSMSLVAKRTPLSNEAIAFLRAYDLAQYTNSMEMLSRSTRYIGVDTENKIGGEYRRVLVRVIVRNALKGPYEELGPLTRRIIQGSAS